MRSATKYIIPKSREVQIGNLKLGAGRDVVVQTMTNTNPLDQDACISQFERLAKAGAQMVRFTTPTLKDVSSLASIRKKLQEEFPEIPIVADVHFNANVANEAASICHKVRINPGNFGEKKISKTEFSDQEYQAALSLNRKKLSSLIDICNIHNTALRIGVNHGSLSERIMSRFGDTPEGMVESALEFLRICAELEFQNVVVSLKSSNTSLMIQSVRLLLRYMLTENLYYPLHLGVTESGDGLQGRIRSVVGLAPLLLEGIGDTIRISLTEAPENEIPVARLINKFFPRPGALPYHPLEMLPWDPFHFSKPDIDEIYTIIGGNNPPVVIGSSSLTSDPEPDIYFSIEEGNWQFIILDKIITIDLKNPLSNYSSLVYTNTVENSIKFAHSPKPFAIILDADNDSFSNIKHWLIEYYNSGGTKPVILKKEYYDTDSEEYALHASGEFGFLLIDHLLSGIWLENQNVPAGFNTYLSFQILQAARNRFTSTEYIACPSCGRTLFDIQTALSEIKKHTSHLKGLKIAVMGCIVNGPGEMADADYGYIGSGSGLVTIYKGKTEIRKKVPESNAIISLIEAIKENGDWKEP
jgi:(E)-4-hydroxy-3-methylbut-2-enyl-diphosphate synthase